MASASRQPQHGLVVGFPRRLEPFLGAFFADLYFILGVYYKLQTFLSMPTNGIIQGVRPLIGYNYGAGELGRVRSIYRTTLVLNGLIMMAGLIICLTIPDVLMGWFTSRQETIAAGASALSIIAWGSVPSALSITASGALEGWGRATRPLPSRCCATLSSACRRRGSSAASLALMACGTPSGSLNVWQRSQPGRFMTTMPQPLRQKRSRHEV